MRRLIEVEDSGKEDENEDEDEKDEHADEKDEDAVEKDETILDLVVEFSKHTKPVGCGVGFRMIGVNTNFQ